MNLDEAISAHRQWKIRLRTFLNGGSQEQFDSATVAKDNQCELGKWLLGSGAAHAARTEYGALKKAHTHFHSEAAHVVTLSGSGDKAGADRYLEGPFTQASTHVVEAISKLKAHV